MEKAQNKIRKDKKKNTETGILMGPNNTNIFSQLSAAYIQNKQDITQQQQSFLKSNPIIEYHSPNINRILTLLRKKADVTKAKAALELREEVTKMPHDDVQQFIGTFSQLYEGMMINEQAKQVIDQLTSILVHLLANHKKIVLKEISRLYGPLLIASKTDKKLLGYLFSGDEQQQNQKSLLLMVNKEVTRKFIIMSKIVLQSDEPHQIIQPNYQRNCSAIMKIIIDLTRISQSNPQHQQPWFKFLEQFDELLVGKTIDEYLNNGGRAKASIIELYSKIIEVYSHNPKLKLNWQHYATVIGDNYTSKDTIVQQSLWKYCNTSFIRNLIRIAQIQSVDNKYALLEKYLPKYSDKLIDTIKEGGYYMYKELPNYMTVFPEVQLQHTDEHKDKVNAITYIRKLLAGLLNNEDQNQARMQCYRDLAVYFIGKLQPLIDNNDESKKAKEINSLAGKSIRQMVEKLQERYYQNPPISKNSPTYHIPPHFTYLIIHFQLSFQFVFHAVHTFTLYHPPSFQHPTPYAQTILDQIYHHCINNQQLSLQYLSHYPKRSLKVDLTQENKLDEIPARIFLLSAQGESEDWFSEAYGQKKRIIIYDPRITQKDLFEIHQQPNNLQFEPISKNLPKIYHNQQADIQRWKYFMRCLRDSQEVAIIKYLIPFVRDYLIVRNTSLIEDDLLAMFQEMSLLLADGKWLVSSHQVIKITVICQLLFQSFKYDCKRDNQKVDNFFENFCEFGRRIFNYKMYKQVQNILQKASTLVMIPFFHHKFHQSLLYTLDKSLQSLTLSVPKEEKTKKLRLNQITQYLQKCLFYLIGSTQSQPEYLSLLLKVLSQPSWKDASQKADLWLICNCIINRFNHETIDYVAKYLVNNSKQYIKPIGLIMCCQIVLPLQLHSEEKYQYTKLQKVLLATIRESASQGQLPFLGNLVRNSLEGGIHIQYVGVKNVISNMVKDLHDKPDNYLRDIVRITMKIPLELMLDTTNSKSISQVLMLFYYVTKDIGELNEVYQLVLANIEKSNGYVLLGVIGIASIIWQSGVGIDSLIHYNQQSFSNIINKLFTTAQQLQSQCPNLVKSVVFGFVNSCYPHTTLQPFKGYEQQLMRMFEQKVDSNPFMHGMVQSYRMKFAYRLFNSFGEKFISYLISNIPIECLNEYKLYSQILNNIEDEEQQQVSHDDIINMFIQYSQVIIRMGNVITPNLQPDQEILLQLLDCPFLGLKKTVFILIRQIYQQKIVKKLPPVIYDRMLTQKFEITEEQIKPLMAAKISTYYYAWQGIIFRRASIQQQKNEEEQLSITLEDYICKDSIYENFLKLSFDLLDINLQYTKNQGQLQIQPQQLASMDIVSIGLDEDQNLNSKLFKLIMRSLFIFVIDFPMFLRDFIDKNKKYRNTCQRILRNVISNAIFKSQVARIQLNSAKWKMSDNFEIYVSSGNKEIYAEYTHEGIRIGLRLMMKPTYPLIPILIEFGKGLKITEGGRWQLMLQTQLHNRNNTIINGILLWKDNIDKTLSGVEQCSICFDIVNSNGLLPKKACKTCKKKFHGNCIMKWFSKSNKSQCPLCKSQFL